MAGGGPGIIDQEIDAAGGGYGRDGGAHRGFVGDIDGMRGEMGMRQFLRSARKPMHGPAIGEQTLSQGKSETLGSTGDEGGRHWF